MTQAWNKVSQAVWFWRLSSVLCHTWSCLDKVQLSLDGAAVPLPGCSRAGAHEVSLSSFQSQHSLCLGKASAILFFPIQSLLLLIMRTHRAEPRAGSFFLVIKFLSVPFLLHEFLFIQSNLVCKPAWLQGPASSRQTSPLPALR